jgi:hypothetical protein
MVKRLAAILVLLLALSGATLANDIDTVPFAVGEKLTYQIFWGPFVVGRATLEVAGIDPVDGYNCYHLVAKAKTSGLADLLFPVDSTAESWLDCDGFFARQYREDRTEGKHHRSGETHYDYARNETVITNHVNGKEKHLSLNQHVQDVISSLYVVRTRKLRLDSEQTFMINAGTTNYNVTVRPDVRKSIWVRPVGDVQALRVEPTPTLNIVSANKGRMWFWLSDDARRLPLLVNSELRLGNAKLVLYSIAAGKVSSGTASKFTDSANSSPAASADHALASGR